LEALVLEYRKIRELDPPINVQYDVHERPSGDAAADRRIAIILPDLSEEKAAVFFVRGAEAAVHYTVHRKAKRPLRKEMKTFFFASREEGDLPEDSAEAARIVWSWLRRNRDKANAFDVDMAGGLEGTVRMLGLYLREEERGERVFHV